MGSFMDNYLTSRFFEITDEKKRDFVFDDIQVNANWISRPYEYRWCEAFVRQSEVVLDAACGICHPLKFFLASKCKEVHACDTDARILSKMEIKKETIEVFGPNALEKISDAILDKIVFQRCFLKKMPYADKYFDKVFCISVLEHLDDYFNHHPFLWHFRQLFVFKNNEIYKSLKEIKRVLKDDGIVLLTMDYPRINLKYLQEVISSLSLAPVEEVDWLLHKEKALFFQNNELSCFRIALRKETNSGIQQKYFALHSRHQRKKVAFDYKDYWNERYRSGGNSGVGSYDKLASYKASFLNHFIEENKIKTVIDFGCGDGAQMSLIHCDSYLGLDVSREAINKCSQLVAGDLSKNFIIYDPKEFNNDDKRVSSDLVICLDVLYHITDDEDYYKTLSDIFSISTSWVILYTSLDAYQRESYKIGSHVRHRNTLVDIARYKNWDVVSIDVHPYPQLSSAQFVVLRSNHQDGNKK